MTRHALPPPPHVATGMLIFDRQAVADALSYTDLVESLAKAFAHDFVTPPRVVHSLPGPDAADATLLMMPAWQPGKTLGVKVVTVFPDNATRGLASVQATYLLLHAATGQPLAVLDGTELTLRRTAAASALASRYLACESSSTLLMVGTGKLAPHMIAAHASVRSIQRVLVWGRRPEQAARLVAEVNVPGLHVEAAASLKQAVQSADIISCATLSREPLIKGDWLKPGQHLDLVGAFTSEMREADDAALRRASVFVDTLDGALSEAGEIMQGLESGAITRAEIRADLAALARDSQAGRQSPDEITLFKSVGCAIEDLAAASLIINKYEATQHD